MFPVTILHYRIQRKTFYVEQCNCVKVGAWPSGCDTTQCRKKGDRMIVRNTGTPPARLHGITTKISTYEYKIAIITPSGTGYNIFARF